MKILNTALIGLGRIGWDYHLPEIMRHSGFNLIAVADTSEERLREVEETYSIQGYASYLDMYEYAKPELVVIASPTHFHFEHAVQAMERGIDVFLDKPMAVDLNEADEIIELMEKTGRKLMVYQPMRMKPEFRILQEIIKRGLIGRIYMIKGSRTGYIRRNDWQAMKKYGGGMVNNYGAHLIDQMLCLTGSPVRRIMCNLQKVASLGDADDVVKALMETQNGIILDLDINMATAESLTPWMVLGSQGTITLKQGGGQYFFHVRYFYEHELGELVLQNKLAADARSYSNFDKIPWHKEEIPVPAPGLSDGFYDKCYEYYALDKEPFIRVSETREVMRIIDECKKNAEWQ